MKPEQVVDRLAQVARAASDERLTAREQLGLLRLERALARRRASQPRRRMAVTAALMVASLAAACLASSLRPKALTFVVAHGSAGESGYVVSDENDTAVRFSDESELGMPRGARLRVVRLEVRGARLMLEGGLVHVHIRPRPRASWAIDAGPYVVHVTGTEFDLSWKPDEQTLDLDLHKGSVTVDGPLANGGIRMVAGQHLVARARDGALFLTDGAGPKAPPAAPASATAAGPPFVSGSPGPVLAAARESSAVTRESNAPIAERPAPPTTSGARASSSGVPSWTSQLAHGDFQGILDDVERRGLDRTLAEASVSELAALAGAARYSQRAELALRALSAERARFPRSAQARDAAFFLGDLAENRGDDATAVDWYETYLRESASGAYASQALGRKILLVQKLRGLDDARPLAAGYLERFPDGPYAAYARKLLQMR